MIGYAFTWFTKWLLVDLLYGRNLIEVALKQVLYRSVGAESFGYLSTINQNISYMKYFFVIIFIAMIVYIFTKFLKNEKNENIIESIPYFLISIIPLVWIFLIRDHSFKHAFFTYRIFLLTIIGLPIGFYYLFNKDTREEKGNN